MADEVSKYEIVFSVRKGWLFPRWAEEKIHLLLTVQEVEFIRRNKLAVLAIFSKGRSNKEPVFVKVRETSQEIAND